MSSMPTMRNSLQFLRLYLFAVALSILVAPFCVRAADLSAREVTERLFKAKGPIDLSNTNLEDLDLSHVDFKGSNLSSAKMFGVNLSNSRLANANLENARLDRITIIGTDFDNANLSGISMLRPSTTLTREGHGPSPPSFKKADLRKAKIFGQLSRSDFSFANLEGASLAPFSKTGFIEDLFRTELEGANLEGANLSLSDLTYVSFRFANLKGINFRGAKLHHVDFSKSDLSGADFTDADVTEADFDGSILESVKGLDHLKGRDRAFNLKIPHVLEGEE
ncbi:MAG: pentapeptide repeat-containing protein [Hyphomicrobium sp.]